jgi:Colicin V production protein
MLLGFLTVLVMLAVAYAYLRPGLMTAFMMCCNVFISGLVAFNFFEPIADALDPMFTGSFLKDYEDAICLLLLFCVTLGLLRLLTNFLCSSMTQFPMWLQYGGSVFFGMLTGYLVAGFLLTVLQTLPWHTNFMFFEPRIDPDQPAAAIRSVLPPDRVWLSLMRRAGAYPLASSEDGKPPSPDLLPDRFVRTHITFDKYGTFELRYARYRRYDTGFNVLRYQGEFDHELHKRR